MARFSMERDRRHPRTEIVWNDGGSISLDVDERFAAGDSVTISGVVDWDYPLIPGLFPRDARVKVDVPGDSATVYLRGMGRNETRAWTANVRPSASPGETITVDVTGEGDDVVPGVGWTGFGGASATMRAQTERDEQVEEALGYAPWVIGGGAAGAGVSMSRNNEVNPVPVVVGGSSGVVLREYLKRTEAGVPEIDLPSNRRLVASAVAIGAVGYLLSQSQRVPGID